MLSQMVLMPLVYYFIRRKGKLFTWRCVPPPHRLYTPCVSLTPVDGSTGAGSALAPSLRTVVRRGCVDGGCACAAARWCFVERDSPTLSPAPATVIGFFVTGLSNVYAYAGCIFLFGAGLVATNTCLNIFISDTMSVFPPSAVHLPCVALTSVPVLGLPHITVTTMSC